MRRRRHRGSIEMPGAPGLLVASVPVRGNALRTLLGRASALALRLRTAWINHSHAGVALAATVRTGSGIRFTITDGARLRVGARCSLGRNGQIVAQGGLIDIAQDVQIGPMCTLVARHCISIGRDTLIAERVSIRDQDHALHGTGAALIRNSGMCVGAVRIGADVWIGAGAVVLRNVTIGDGAVVGANAVVTRDVAAGAIVAGVPARQIGWRDRGTP